jgi:hydrogenase maturation factor HypE
MAAVPAAPPADGWQPVYYEVNEESGTLRLGGYRVVGDRVWARNAAGSVGFLRREKHLDDVVVARRGLHLLKHGQ